MKAASVAFFLEIAMLEFETSVDRNEAIWAMRKSGETYAAIGRKVGLSDTVVAGYCKKYEARERADANIKYAPELFSKSDLMKSIHGRRFLEQYC
jgi:hypothetical protein